MTIQELYDHTSQLGFETSLEDDSRFYQAAQRALLQVNRIRPAKSFVTINHSPIQNAIINHPSDIVRKDSEDLCFSAYAAKAFYFESDIARNTGNVVIEYYDADRDAWVVIKDFNKDRNNPLPQSNPNHQLIAYRGFIKIGITNNFYTSNHIRLRFTGDFAYNVRNVALYQILNSAEESGIPAYGEYTRYDIAGFATDFSTLCHPPIRDGAEQFALGKNYAVEGKNALLLPRSLPGVYKVWYERKLEAIDTSGTEEAWNKELDLDEDLAALMPLLVAGYVWLDDEPAKASYYLDLYREQEAKIIAAEKRLNPIKIKNVYGW